jgi:hypothetical protein
MMKSFHLFPLRFLRFCNGLCVPIVAQMPLKTLVEPVKWTPAKSRLARTVSVSFQVSKTTLITPSGTPASLNTSIMICAEKVAVTWFPYHYPSCCTCWKISGNAPKLNGVMHKRILQEVCTLRRFHVSEVDVSLFPIFESANAAENAKVNCLTCINLCLSVLDCAIIVAALI